MGPVVVVVVTNWKVFARRSLMVVAVTIILFACGVTPSPSTPSAFNCDPTTTDVTTFETGPWPFLQANCITCHGNYQVTTTLHSRLVFNTQPAVTLTDEIENLCIAYQFGQNSPSQAIVTHPQQTIHDGGVFQAVTMTPLINWVNTYVLPNQ